MANFAQLAQMAEAVEGEMMYAGIFTPDAGVREDMPSISLPEAFTAESVNCLLRYGQIQRMPMRLKDLVEAAFTAGTVTVTSGSKTVTLSNTGWASAATHLPHWAGRDITITDSGSTARTYAIASVTYGAANSIITLAENYAGASEAGLAYSIGTVGTKVATPDDNPIIHYHRFIRLEGGSEIERLFVFTKANAYLWDTVWSAFVLKFTCGSDCTLWDTDEINNQLAATNGVDKVQVWGATTNALFAPLCDTGGLEIETGVFITAAKYLAEYQGYLLVGYITHGVSGVLAEDIYWCSYGDETDWDTGGTGDAGGVRVSGGGVLRGFGKYGTDLIVAKARKMARMWPVTSSDVFNIAEISPKGCIAPHSMVNDGDGRFYWLADDYTIRRFPEGKPVSDALARTLLNLNPSLQANVEATYIDTYGQVWFSVPHTGEAAGNNKIIWFDTATGRMGSIDLAVASFGRWKRQTTYTYDTLEQILGISPADYADWGEAWGEYDISLHIAGFPLDIAADYSGYSYDLHCTGTDDGNAYTTYFVLSTDLLEKLIAKRYGVSIRTFKRIFNMQLYVRGEAEGTAAIYVKRDNESGWQAVNTAVSLESTADIAVVNVPCDVRARHFLIKVSAANAIRFIGIIFGFIQDGDR